MLIRTSSLEAALWVSYMPLRSPKNLLHFLQLVIGTTFTLQNSIYKSTYSLNESAIYVYNIKYARHSHVVESEKIIPDALFIVKINESYKIVLQLEIAKAKSVNKNKNFSHCGKNKNIFEYPLPKE